MKKLFFLILLLFIQIDVYANTDLVNLSVNDKSVSCSGYECSIEVDANSATITYELGETVKSATPPSGHKVTLSNDYSVKIEVEYHDLQKANYTLTIKKHVESSDNTLNKLIINDEEVVLKEDIYVYSYDTKFNDEIIKISGVANDSNATCEEMEYDFDLDKSSLSITYPVKAENGDVRNYTIILKRKNRPDTTLKSLILSDIEFEFDAQKMEYEITVPYSVFKTSIDAVPNAAAAEVIVNEIDDLIVGENIIELTVKNDEATDTYTIKINRLENLDETLANLKKLEIENYKLKFDPNIYEYDLFFNEIPSVLIINAIGVSDSAKIDILDNENLVENSVVSIKVELDNGLVKTYKLNIKIKEDIIKEYNKTLIIILIVILVIIMIVLLILQLREGKNNRRTKKNVKKILKKQEEEIELI